MPPTNLEATLSVRVSTKLRTAFQRRARRNGKSSDVLRMLVEAYVDGRISVTPKPTKELL